MKKIKLSLSFVMLLMFAFFAGNTYSQDAVELGSSGISYAIGDSCYGPGSLRYDNNTFENGYGWNTTVTDGRWVMKMRPTSYPWQFTKMCIGLTRISTGTANMTFDVVVYDTMGAGGSPGAVVTTIAGQVATGLLVFPAYSWFNFSLASVPVLNGGAYYIGIKYSAAAQTGQYVMADENGILWPGYAWANAGPWTTTQTFFALYKAQAIRTEGNGGAPPAPQMTLCRGGLLVPLLDHQYGRDSMLVNLGAGCTILDVNVRIDTVIHTWDADLTFYLNRGATSVNIINKVGGSGDNFINTVLNDSAATLISAGVAPFTGSFRPSNPLAPFNGAFVSGYWRLSISDTAGGDTGTLRRWCLVITYNCPVGGIQTVEIPNYYSLSQNYPNPFNPSTSIKFTMPKAENVKLVVFDILGREVATLVNEFRSSGTYNVNFDASTLASGVYFYSLQTPGFTETKRMLLVK